MTQQVVAEIGIIGDPLYVTRHIEIIVFRNWPGRLVAFSMITGVDMAYTWPMRIFRRIFRRIFGGGHGISGRRRGSERYG
jgi:hypothetical protein